MKILTKKQENKLDSYISDLKMDLEYQKDQTAMAEETIETFRAEVRRLKEERAKAIIELEDANGFLVQERHAKEILLQEIKKIKKEKADVKRKLTNLKKEFGVVDGK